jgi:WD40 repeat protein/regulator of sirC expression with transglutaminase-like and TPR domain
MTRLWDTATGKEKGVLRGHDDGVWWVAFSPDGKTLATSDRYISMIVWDMNTRKPLHRISQPVSGLAFSPDSKQLTGVLESNSSFHATIWDVATGEDRLRLDAAGLLVGYLPDGKSLITLSNQYAQDSEVVCWDLEHAQPRYRIATPGIFVATLSPDGTCIVVASNAGTLIYDSATGEQTEAISGQSGIRGLALSPDNKLVACSKDNDKIVSVVSLETGKTLVEDVHLDPVWAVAFSPNGKLLASASLGGAIKLWDMTPAEEAATISVSGANTLQFSPDGVTLFVGNSGPTKIIDVTSGKEISQLPTSGVTSISADASRLARSAGDGQANVWELRSGREIANLPLRATGSARVTLSPDGKQAATFSPWRNDNTVQLWDLNTQQARTFVPKLAANSVHCAEFSPNGKLLAAGFQFQMFTVWDLASGEIKLELDQEPFMMNVFSIAFSSDNRTLAVGTDIGAVTLWDIHSGKKLAACDGHALPVQSMAFAPDGTTLATASDDKTVKLWDTITGQERSTLIGHQGSVRKIQFSPDGSTLATASHDGTVKLWRVATDLGARARRSPSLWADHGTAVSANFAKWSEALTGFSEAIQLDPKQAPAWTGRGWAHMKLNQLDKALADHNQAIELDPKQALYWNNRSVTYLKLNKPDDALEDCAKAIELAPKFAPPWFNRGEAYRLLGQPEKAADAYLTALRLKTLPKPDVSLAHRNLASALEAMEKNQPDSETLRRFRTEAKELRKITEEKSTTKPESK